MSNLTPRVSYEIFVAHLYAEAATIAYHNNQVVGEKSDYYVTLAQLESLFVREIGKGK